MHNFLKTNAKLWLIMIVTMTIYIFYTMGYKHEPLSSDVQAFVDRANEYFHVVLFYVAAPYYMFLGCKKSVVFIYEKLFPADFATK